MNGYQRCPCLIGNEGRIKNFHISFLQGSQETSVKQNITLNVQKIRGAPKKIPLLLLLITNDTLETQMERKNKISSLFLSFCFGITKKTLRKYFFFRF